MENGSAREETQTVNVQYLTLHEDGEVTFCSVRMEARSRSLRVLTVPYATGSGSHTFGARRKSHAAVSTQDGK